MIKFTLSCVEGHKFESWFHSAEAFEKLAQKQLISCAICGSHEVKKALMAPQVTPSRRASAERAAGDIAPPDEAPPPSFTDAATPQEAMLRKLKEHLSTSSEDVGKRFAAEARAMHSGETKPRSIHGEARIDEAKALLEEGIDVIPLPFAPKNKVN